MSLPRLPFLWPFLYRVSAPTAQRVPRVLSKRAYRTTPCRRQAEVIQRYGTANEPFLPPDRPQKSKIGADSSGTVIDVKALSKSTSKPKQSASDSGPDIQHDKAEAAHDEGAGTEQYLSASSTSKEISIPKPHAHKSKHAQAGEIQNPTSAPQPNGPIDHILQQPTSSSLEMATVSSSQSMHSEDHRPPHIATPQFVHHFDTYSLVKDLESGGWTHDQSVTIMKAVRLILVENMNLASEGLVSRSNVENESYLFRAACSELKTEISAKRKAELEKAGTQRAQIQHDVEILSQKLSQQGAVLKDELKGMFDDRQMAVRNEQRSMESKIQELNYRITVSLNSDSRSEVEGVRWLITKRAITALAICVLMVLCSLKYSSVKEKQREEERKRVAYARASAAAATSQALSNENRRRNVESPNVSHARDGDGDGSATTSHGASGEQDRRPGSVGEVFVQDGDNPSYVSLG